MTVVDPAAHYIPAHPIPVEPLHPIASLIDHHRFLARQNLTAAHLLSATFRVPRFYMPPGRHDRSDLANTLAVVADDRRLLAALLTLRRAGVLYMTGSRWRGMSAAILAGPSPTRPLQVVATGHGVLPDNGDGCGEYPMTDGRRYVGELWHNRHGEWRAFRRGTDGGVTAADGATVSAGHRTADAAAYAVGWLIADH
ncbi:hypothetical protein ACIBTV_25455 [Micromonospora sp. NPDC049366]|uniref:hypothetical protein n=1 Tax=Micromonospora sp. NPDC049366 TaxID=3364271 RepID=UPI00378BE551